MDIKPAQPAPAAAASPAPTASAAPAASAAVPAPAPKPPAAVMDVKPPAAETVHAAPVQAADKHDATEKPAVKPPKVIKPKTPRQPGVAMAIIASVVIILGLAVLAVYAYLQSAGAAVS